MRKNITSSAYQRCTLYHPQQSPGCWFSRLFFQHGISIKTLTIILDAKINIILTIIQLNIDLTGFGMTNDIGDGFLGDPEYHRPYIGGQHWFSTLMNNIDIDPEAITDIAGIPAQSSEQSQIIQLRWVKTGNHPLELLTPIRRQFLQLVRLFNCTLSICQD